MRPICEMKHLNSGIPASKVYDFICSKKNISDDKIQFILQVHI